MSDYQHQSRYCYPGTDVLINKLDIRDPSLLKDMELALTSVRLHQLYDRPIAGNFDLKHMQQIHKFIFQDIYPFAGAIRTEDIQKGSTPFASVRYLNENAKDIFSQLKNEKFLNGLKAEPFSERLAHYMAEINILHPFRDGNGRTTRELIRTIAKVNGYEINWSRVDAKDLLRSSIESVYDPSNLAKNLFKTIVNKQPSLQMNRVNQNELER